MFEKQVKEEKIHDWTWAALNLQPSDLCSNAYTMDTCALPDINAPALGPFIRAFFNYQISQPKTCVTLMLHAEFAFTHFLALHFCDAAQQIVSSVVITFFTRDHLIGQYRSYCVALPINPLKYGLTEI